MSLRERSAFPIHFTRFASTFLLLGALAGCGSHGSGGGGRSDSSAANGTDVSAAGDNSGVTDDAATPQSPQRFRLRLTHRYARHRHAGPR